jgi:hypothetical protein
MLAARCDPSDIPVHAHAVDRQLDWVRDYALAGDLESAFDAVRDAVALAQELQAAGTAKPAATS